MVFKRLLSLFLLISSIQGHCIDLSDEFKKIYDGNETLTEAEQSELKEFDFYLVLGSLQSHLFQKIDVLVLTCL
jgi:hypothetical protein